jgi:hypothetical protein
LTEKACAAYHVPVLLLPWDFVSVGAKTISHEEDNFLNQFSKPFLDKTGFGDDHSEDRMPTNVH